MVLTRLVNPRFDPSSLCPDLSSFLLPAGRKHSIWIDFSSKNRPAALQRTTGSVTGQAKMNTTPSKLRGWTGQQLGDLLYADFKALWAFI